MQGAYSTSPLSLPSWTASTPPPPPLPPSLQAYAVVVAFLMPQYALYAYDASTHSSEEAKRSDVTTPVSMLASLSTVTLLGWGVLVALTFCIQDPQALYESLPGKSYDTQVLIILLDVFQGR